MSRRIAFEARGWAVEEQTGLPSSVSVTIDAVNASAGVVEGSFTSQFADADGDLSDFRGDFAVPVEILTQ